MNKTDLKARIGYQGELQPIIKDICNDYNIGDLAEYKIIETGYEDFNLIVKTSHGKYFLKIFASFRTDLDCIRYKDVIISSLEAGVNHPKVLKCTQGDLFSKIIDNHKFRLMVMEYINGKDLFDQEVDLSEDEKKFIIDQAVKTNSINIKPSFIYDSWAIVNFIEEYKKSKPYLDTNIIEVMEPIKNDLEKIDIKSLPHCLVHGDLIKTNIMRTETGELYIIDFGVANYYPRIVELAVLECNVLFDEKSDKNTQENYILALKYYQEKIKLTEEEIRLLPLFVKIAHAMHVIRGVYEREVNQNHLVENNYFIDLGMKGLNIS